MHLKAGENQTVEFHLGGLKPGTLQGRVRIDGPGLALPRTTSGISPWKCGRRGRCSSWLSRRPAARPSTGNRPSRRQAARARHRPLSVRRRSTTASLPRGRWRTIRPSACSIRREWKPGIWQRLTDYAAAGHGVGVFLGRHSQPIEAFNSPAAQQLLPGQLKDQVPREEGDMLPGPAEFPESPPQAVRIVRHADALEPLSRLSLLADRRPESRREHDRGLQRRPPCCWSERSARA